MLDCVVDRVVPLHQVDRQQPVSLASDRDHGVGLFERHRQRFLADDVLAGFEGCEGLGIVQKRRSRDIDQVDVISCQQLVDVLRCPGYRTAAAAACAACRFVPAMPISLTPGTWVNCCRA